MINYYNAFISYKHADLDNKIAEEIVRRLERYHIPKKIQKDTGIKKINRIFRDKDELPITNDLNDTIASALANSDYLIVICSTNTRRSTWVEKEIETFLKNHTKNQILTVLADGEPFEVIPKILLNDEKTIQDEHGVFQTITVPLEPLSCDYRLPIKKARAEELPRLAATLIGCSYDELMNRQRQYKMKRLTSIFAVAMAIVLGFAGYMLYSNTLIHKNYIESLKNQSKYLANESGKQLDDENRIEAMQLALAALPEDENDDMPVTPEALKAITNASYAYVAPAGTNMAATWNYQMPGHVSSFKLSDDSSVLAAKDTSGVVMAWDVASHQELLQTIKADDKTSDYMFFNPNTLIVSRDYSVAVYNLKDGSEAWTYDFGKYAFSGASYIKYSDKSFLACNSHGEIIEFNIENGAVLNHTYIFGEEESTSLSFDTYCQHYSLSPDGKKLAFSASNKAENYEYSYSVFEYNFDTNEVKSEVIGNNYIGNIEWQNNNIYVSCSLSGLDSSMSMYAYSYITEDHTGIYCYDSDAMTQKWAYDFVCEGVAINNGFLPMDNNTIAYYAGNISEIWDSETGELLNRYNVNDSIIDISDNDHDGQPLYITEGGNTASPQSKGETTGIGTYQRFSDNLDDALVGKGVYTHKYLTSAITYYAVSVYDETYKVFSDAPKLEYTLPDDIYIDESLLALLEKVDDNNCRLHLYDVQDKSYQGDVSLDGLLHYKVNILGTYYNKLYILGVTRPDDKYIPNLYEIDLQTKKLSVTAIETLTGLGSDSFEAKNAVFDGSRIIYYDSTYNAYGIGIIDLATKENKKITIENLDYSYLRMIKCFPETGTVYLEFDDYEFLINLATEEIKEIHLTENWNNTTLAVYDEKSGIYAFTDDQTIVLLNSNGDYSCEISSMNLMPFVMGFYQSDDEDNCLIVAYDNGTLYRYNTESGEFVGKSDLSVYSNASRYSYDRIVVDEESNHLYVYAGGILDIFELDSWTETTAITGCYDYNKTTDTFIVYGYENADEYQVGYFNHYTTDQLIEKTKDLLQGIEMTEDQKSMYGIG